MTREQALSLHDPFRNDDLFRIQCKSEQPNLSLLRDQESVRLIFPNQDWIDLVAQTPSIKAVYVDRPRARNLNLKPLTSLKLYHFSTSYPSGVKDWSFLAEIPTLRKLALHNTLSIRGLEPLEKLTELEVLILSGGYSSVLHLSSLSVLINLKKLKAIFLAALRFESWNLDPVLGLPDLVCFDAPLYWPKEEIEKLARRRPKVTSNLFDA